MHHFLPFSTHFISPRPFTDATTFSSMPLTSASSHLCILCGGGFLVLFSIYFLYRRMCTFFPPRTLHAFVTFRFPFEFLGFWVSRVSPTITTKFQPFSHSSSPSDPMRSSSSFVAFPIIHINFPPPPPSQTPNIALLLFLIGH